MLNNDAADDKIQIVPKIDNDREKFMLQLKSAEKVIQLKFQNELISRLLIMQPRMLLFIKVHFQIANEMEMPYLLTLWPFKIILVEQSTQKETLPTS